MKLKTLSLAAKFVIILFQSFLAYVKIFKLKNPFFWFFCFLICAEIWVCWQPQQGLIGFRTITNYEKKTFNAKICNKNILTFQKILFLFCFFCKLLWYLRLYRYWEIVTKKLWFVINWHFKWRVKMCVFGHTHTCTHWWNQNFCIIIFRILRIK